MEIAETACDFKTLDQNVRLTRDWCDKASVSRTPIEMAALCCALVRLRAWDELDEMPQKNHLSCGYHLARAGFLQMAARFIMSGIYYCEQHMPKAPMWRYHLELWTVSMRLGQWNQAELWLSNTWVRLSKRRNLLPSDGLDLWKQSGELGEFRLTLASLLSDCYIAQGRFSSARKWLLIALGIILPMRDVSIRATRLALESRLVSVLLQLRDLQNAAATAIRLCRELKEHGTFLLESQALSWTVQEILACSNELVHEERHGDAFRVLHELKKLTKDGPGVLPDDLSALIDQNWKEVMSMLDFNDLDFARESLIGPLTDPIQSVTTSNGNHSQRSDLAAGVLKPGHETNNYGYTFPVPASRTDAISM